MIGETARPDVIAALERRLAAIGMVDSGPAMQRAPGEDAEEALRELMVRLLPDAAVLDPERRARVCELFISISDHARSPDVRYLDAFNVWFEAVDGQEEWAHDPRWRVVRAIHASALAAAIARLSQSRRPGSAAATVDHDRQPNDAAPARGRVQVPARVLILADHWISGLRIWRAVSRISHVTPHCLICNNQSASGLRFAMRQALAAASTGPNGLLTLGLALVRRRVRLTTSRLHADQMVGWVRNMRFSIGLHAMGVIYRPSILTAFQRGVLNSHIGLLPEYRGRSVMEWSILAGAPTGITVFFMDAGIDTGRDMVLRRSVDVSGVADVFAAKRSLFHRDGEMYAAALRALLESPDAPLMPNAGGRRYYVMSQLLISVVTSLLTGAAQSCADAARSKQAA